jgi:hypothetical protein
MKYAHENQYMLSQYIALYSLRLQKTPYEHLIKTLGHKES